MMKLKEFWKMWGPGENKINNLSDHRKVFHLKSVWAQKTLSFKFYYQKCNDLAFAC